MHPRLIFCNAQCNYGPMGTDKEKVTKDKKTPKHPLPPKMQENLSLKL